MQQVFIHIVIRLEASTLTEHDKILGGQLLQFQAYVQHFGDFMCLHHELMKPYDGGWGSLWNVELLFWIDVSGHLTRFLSNAETCWYPHQTGHEERELLLMTRHMNFCRPFLSTVWSEQQPTGWILVEHGNEEKYIKLLPGFKHCSF